MSLGSDGGVAIFAGEAVLEEEFESKAPGVI